MSNVWNMILKPDIWDRQNGFEISNLVLPPTILWLGEFLLWPDVLPTFPNYYFPNIHVLRICITHNVDKDTRTTTVSTSPITNKIKIIWNQVPLFVVPHFRPPKKKPLQKLNSILASGIGAGAVGGAGLGPKAWNGNKWNHPAESEAELFEIPCFKNERCSVFIVETLYILLTEKKKGQLVAGLFDWIYKTSKKKLKKGVVSNFGQATFWGPISWLDLIRKPTSWSYCW